MNNKQYGWTLIELIVTIAIFAIITILSYFALQSSFKNKDIQGNKSKELIELQKAFNYLERDITQIYNQKDIILDKNGLTITSIQNDKLFIIRYSVVDNKLIRIDMTNQENHINLQLIDDIKNMTFLLLDNNNKWHKFWHYKLNSSVKAIEIKFKHKSWGMLKKLVLIHE